MGLFTGMSVISIFEFIFWMLRPSQASRSKDKPNGNTDIRLDHRSTEFAKPVQVQC